MFLVDSLFYVLVLMHIHVNICIFFDVLPSTLEWRPYVMTWMIMWFFRRRESTEVEDIFLAHISGMDTLARGLQSAAKLIQVRSLVFILSTNFSWKVFLLSWFWCLWICSLRNKGWFIGWACSQTLSEFWYRNRGTNRGNMLPIPILSCFLISIVANKYASSNRLVREILKRLRSWPLNGVKPRFHLLSRYLDSNNFASTIAKHP